uniref:histidine kinase n=2 Tax=Chromera velia CCMP2878 TaxID=1169474 RepID=A0A0K6S936_9ALVE|eukprot:Cvel_26771.t1-p1 / transcript=Cvel_26771.t1 / gene=Cvel_26771 / organism=Chromera_velia_CCMP2878 / gene_product=Hybrid signal transduction histidine kinase G, putative / transcript_product=Hybrid signal transduction histidine kinase G, putative / location=Cvel_scaffold3237:3443-5365(+) / protein_length=641 / sequence_SO=supercontig / SO=protein_coding / is_pseudo=false
MEADTDCHAEGVHFESSLHVAPDVQTLFRTHPVGVADFSRLEQVISNFLSNAKKFTQKGSVRLRFEIGLPNEGECTGEEKALFLEAKQGSSAVSLENEKNGNDRDVAGPIPEHQEEQKKKKEKKSFPWVVLRVSVIDTGAGLSEEDRGKLFVPYTQIRAGELQNGGGTGLGLCICKSFVEAHAGGKVGVESEGRGNGSTFFFQLWVPLLHSKYAPDNQQTQEQDSSMASAGQFERESSAGRRESVLSLFSDTPEKDLNALAAALISPRPSQDVVNGGIEERPTEAVGIAGENGAPCYSSPLNRENVSPKTETSADVLLVDDDRFCLMAGSAAIKRLGFSVRTAEDGTAACDLVIGQRSSFRFILMDRHMPKMDGPTAVRQIVSHFSTQAEEERENGTLRPIIVGCTGDATKESEVDFIRAGADTVLVKPLQPHQLARTLQDLEQASPHARAKVEARGGKPPGPSHSQVNLPPTEESYEPPEKDVTAEKEESADVLLVDDDRFCLMAGSAAIKRLGFSVRTAEDGDEACDLVISKSVDFKFILMDKNMARMEGPEAVAALVSHFWSPNFTSDEKRKEQGERGRERARPCIIGYTGDATAEARSAFTQAGADRVIFKPLQPQQLAETLKELHEQRTGEIPGTD